MIIYKNLFIRICIRKHHGYNNLRDFTDKISIPIEILLLIIEGSLTKLPQMEFALLVLSLVLMALFMELSGGEDFQTNIFFIYTPDLAD